MQQQLGVKLLTYLFISTERILNVKIVRSLLDNFCVYVAKSVFVIVIPLTKQNKKRQSTSSEVFSFSVTEFALNTNGV